MRKAASMARGAWSETSEPSDELMSRSKLMTPRPMVTGSISLKMRPTRGSRGLKCQSKRKPTRGRTGTDMTSWMIVPSSTPNAYAYSWFWPWKNGLRTSSPTMITTFHTSGAIAGMEKCS